MYSDKVSEDSYIQWLFENFDDVIKGLPINLGDLEKGDREIFYHIASHCILNGPVGVAKKGSFVSLIGDGSIRDYFGITTSQFRATCLMLAEKIPSELATRSQYYKLHGGLWPMIKDKI